MSFHKLLVPFALLGMLLISSLAMADPTDLNANTDRLRSQVPKYNLQFWRPAPNPGDYLTTYGSMIDAAHWRVTGGFYANYAHVPFKIKYTDESQMKNVIVNPVFLDLYASLSLFSWAEIAVVMPVLLYEDTDTTFQDSKVFGLSQAHHAAGAGDLRVVVKGKILDLNKYPVGLALIGDLSAPTGKKGVFVSDDMVSFTINAALEFNPWDKARMAVNVGYRYRPKRDIYGFTMGQAFIISGATSIPFFHQDLDLLLDLRGEIATYPSDDNLTQDERPFEADLAFRYRFLRGTTEWWRGFAMTLGVGTGIGIGGPDVRAFLGLNFHWVNGGMLGWDYEFGGFMSAVDPCPDPDVTPPSQIPERCRNVLVDSDGDTIPDKDDKCPFAGRAGQIDEFGCSPDRDGDTIPDYADLCPDEGGRVDRNGCPVKLDSDGDGLLDEVDKCPYEPETFNGYEDEDGCPDADPDALVELTAGKINIKEQVFFETSKAVIKSESFELLNQVAQLLIDNPHVGNVTVEGHTDSRGKYDYNVKLSQDRAESVMKYLVDRGVDSKRLNAVGYGPDRPIDSNDTKEGRARNRRVEFVVLGLPDDAKTPAKSESSNSNGDW
ncbi:MAG: OmpA family protein [Proteobacteria bacterium]|nr:OmpA family protein [Pseudomonadota bacterium]